MRSQKQGLAFYIALLVSAITIAIFAQAANPPQFRAGITLVELEVSVLDRKGIPVQGLLKADFRLLEEGQLRNLVTFSEVGSSDGRSSRGSATESDKAHESLVGIILLDDAQIPNDPRVVMRAKSIARSVIESLEPADAVAVLFSRNTSASQEFTTDRSRLLDVVNTVRPGRSSQEIASRSENFASDAVMIHEARITLRLLQSIADKLAELDMRRKAIFYVSPGVTLPPQNTQAYSMIIQSMRNLFVAAERANTIIYGIDPGGLGSGPGVGVAESARFGSGAMSGLSSRHEFLMMLADNTGGRSIVDQNNPEKSVSGLVQGHQHYYLLAYESDDGSALTKRLALTTRRAGTTARFRLVNRAVTR